MHRGTVGVLLLPTVLLLASCGQRYTVTAANRTDSPVRLSLVKAKRAKNIGDITAAPGQSVTLTGETNRRPVVLQAWREGAAEPDAQLTLPRRTTVEVRVELVDGVLTLVQPDSPAPESSDADR